MSLTNNDTQSETPEVVVDTSNYALQVALKTMRERCQQLQQRLATVENENCSLRIKSRDKTSLPYTNPQSNSKPETEILQDRIIQLTKQKIQMAHNVSMVADENRKLWDYLSQLIDKNNSLGNQLVKINDTLNLHKNMTEDLNPPTTPTTNLIRSKTFTQNSPRLKLKTNQPPVTDDVSLEEISLKIIDSFLKEKAELEDQYAQMVELQNESDINVNSIGFTYLDDSDEESSNIEFKKCSDKLISFKESLLLQQTALKTIVNRLSDVNLNAKCPICDGKKASKSVETKEKQIQVQNCESLERICPMCGKIFLNSLPMEDFLNHVESHFLLDPTSDNYEIVTAMDL